MNTEPIMIGTAKAYPNATHYRGSGGSHVATAIGPSSDGFGDTSAAFADSRPIGFVVDH